MRKRFREFRMASRAAALALCVFAPTLFGVGTGAQMLDQDPGHSRFLLLEGIKFSCPKGFACTRSRAEGGAIYVPDRKYDLELVVGIVTKDAA